MKFEIKSKILIGIVLSIFMGFLFLSFTVPCFSWETQDPELAKASAEMIGFKVKDKVGKVAPEIKAGLVIDSNNYKQYPGLAELLPKSLYDRLDPKSYAPLAPIKIKETDQYHNSWGWIRKSLETAKTVKIGADGLSLEGYAGGFPSIKPKSGVELIQWADRSYRGDTTTLHPMRLRLYNRNNKPERELRQQCFVRTYKYPTDWLTPVEPNPENIDYVVSGVFIYPKDISGTSYVRKRFVSSDKLDEFLLFVSSMRRIRRMSGRDTQDPLFGSDLVWDDYNAFWQKVSNTQFAYDYKMLDPKEVLCPTVVDYNWPKDRSSAGFTDYNVDESGAQVYLNFGSWQRRWLYGLEATSKDNAYLYSKRVITFDPEVSFIPQTQLYDRSGRLWRSWVRDANLSQKGEGYMEELIDIVDHVNQHRTILDFTGERNPRWQGLEYSDVRFLSAKAK